jgi:transcriptional repressor NrdR
MDSKVVDSRMIEDGSIIRRRRECERCWHRFSTFERIWLTELTVIKKDWTKELYDRAKLRKSVLLAFAKRPYSPDAVDSLLTNLEIELQANGHEITSKQIWDDILEGLKKMDPVVYVRFASVYKSFDSFEDFKHLID